MTRQTLPGLADRLSLLALGAMLSLPFLVPIHTNPLPSFHSEWLACVLGLAATPVLLSPGHRGIAFPRTAIAPLVLAAIALIQVAAGRLAYAETGFLVALVMFWAAWIMAIAATLKEKLGLLPVAEHLAAWLLAGTLACGALGLVAQLDFWRGWAIPAPLGGNLAQKNHFADYLFLGLASALFLAERGRLAFPAFLGATAILTQAAMISGSRATLLYAAALVATGLYWKQPGYGKRILVLIAAVALGAIAASFWPAVDPVTLPTARIVQTAVSSTGEQVRLALYGLAWDMFREAPWLGQGFGAFPSYSFFHADQSAVPGWVGMAEHPHNLFAQLLAEAGLPATIIVAMALALWIRAMLRKGNDGASPWLAGIAGILLIHAQVEYPLSYTYLLGILALVLGLGERTIVPLKASRTVLAALLASGLLTSGLLARDYLRLQQIRGQTSRDENPASVRKFADELIALRQGSLIKPYVDWNFALFILPNRDHLEDKLSVCRDILRFNPVDDAAFNCARVFELAGKHEEAKRLWELASRVSPSKLSHYLSSPISEKRSTKLRPFTEN